MRDTRTGFEVGKSGWVFCLTGLLFMYGFPVASAQCSQATRPEAAASDQSTTPAQDTPPPTASAQSSSSETAGPVRFVTGSAITVLEDTPLQVINDVPISSRTTKAGAELRFTVTRDVIVNGVLVIPCGATVYGTVVEAKQAGRLVGASNLTLQLTALNLGGRSYPLYTPPFKVVSQSKTAPTVRKVATGAAVGAVAMEATVPWAGYTTYTVGSPAPVHHGIPAADQAKGDAIVAGMGAGVGAVIAVSTPPSIAVIPAESQMEFTLASPIAVYSVDQRTAAQLARGLHQGGPVLYVRGESQ